MQPRAPGTGDRHDDAISRSMTLLAKSSAASEHHTPSLTLTERDEIARAKRNPTAFGPLYERYVDAVYTYCARRVDDPGQAEDLTALVFTRALAALPRYREDGGSFRSWLFSIAHNTVIDSYRTRYEHVSIEADDLGRTLAHPAHGPEHVALQRDLRDAFRAAMAELTEAQREVVAMRLAGLTGPEIASAAGMSLAAVKSTQFRAYTRLRDLLSHYADTDPGKDSNDA
jgi:RNA polymerase sigma-70 factor, ECF subfamily